MKDYNPYLNENVSCSTEQQNVYFLCQSFYILGLVLSVIIDALTTGQISDL